MVVAADWPVYAAVVLVKSLVAVVGVAYVVKPVLYYNLLLLWSAGAHILLENQGVILDLIFFVSL